MNAGGFIGYCSSNVKIIDCFSEGKLRSEIAKTTGGFIGYLASENNTIENSYSTFDVEGTDDVGGFIGRVASTSTGLSIIGCRASGSLFGQNRIGGFIGYLEGAGRVNISDCFAEVKVTGMRNNIGGFIGQINGMVKNS